MKKLFVLFLTIGLALTLAACNAPVQVEPDPEPQDVDCDLYPNAVECIVVDPDNPQPGLINVLAELPTEEISIDFWHVYGQDKEALLLNYIAEFEALYPNVTVNATSQGGYDDLRNKTILAISAGNTPTMLVAYPDHIAGYLNGDAVIPLDDFIYDEDYGWGIDVDDFIPSYIDENKQYQGGFMYSLPYSKSTEMMVFNKTYFEANGITIPIDRALSFTELEGFMATMLGDGANQCEYLINYDSSANFFINNVRMWDGGYTNSDGDILVDDPNTEAMLNAVKAYFDSKMIALPIAWNQQYGSTNFKAGDSCMTVGSTAGISYNVPDPGTFEIGVAPIPQWDMENNPSATQQGPNVAIMADTTDAERLAAWLFIKYITDAEQTAKWSMLTGYLPVRTSGYDSDVYQEFLSIATLDDLDTHVFSDELKDFLGNPADYVYESMTANAAYLQIDYNNYDPAFALQTTSSDARLQAGIIMEAIFAGNATVAEAIAEMLYQLGAD
jgi:multiple sugar transport system substrate-binding protein